MRNLFFAVALVISIANMQPIMAQAINGEISQSVQSDTDEMSITDTLAFTPAGTDNVIGFAGASAACSKLSLSDDQLEKLYNIKNKFADSSSLKRAELQTQSRKLRDLLTQKEIDRKQIEQVQAKVNQLKTELSDLHLSMKVDSMDVLTAEQRTQIRHMKMGRSFAGKRHGHGFRKPVG